MQSSGGTQSIGLLEKFKTRLHQVEATGILPPSPPACEEDAGASSSSPLYPAGPTAPSERSGGSHGDLAVVPDRGKGRGKGRKSPLGLLALLAGLLVLFAMTLLFFSYRKAILRVSHQSKTKGILPDETKAYLNQLHGKPGYQQPEQYVQTHSQLPLPPPPPPSSAPPPSSVSNSTSQQPPPSVATETVPSQQAPEADPNFVAE